MFAELMFHYFALRKWKLNPAATKRRIGLLSSWKEDRPENNLPLSPAEVTRMKKFLGKHAPSMYRNLFLE
jgi:hypothetical protein